MLILLIVPVLSTSFHVGGFVFIWCWGGWMGGMSSGVQTGSYICLLGFVFFRCSTSSLTVTLRIPLFSLAKMLLRACMGLYKSLSFPLMSFSHTFRSLQHWLALLWFCLWCLESFPFHFCALPPMFSQMFSLLLKSFNFLLSPELGLDWGFLLWPEFFELHPQTSLLQSCTLYGVSYLLQFSFYTSFSSSKIWTMSVFMISHSFFWQDLGHKIWGIWTSNFVSFADHDWLGSELMIVGGSVIGGIHLVCWYPVGCGVILFLVVIQIHFKWLF